MNLIGYLQTRLAQLPADDPQAQAQRRIVRLYLDQAELTTRPSALGASGDARLGALADVCQILAEAHGWQPDAPTP